MSISISAVTLSAAIVVAGNSIAGTVHLNAVPTFDVVAAVAVLPATAGTVPAHVTIRKGCQSATFTLAAAPSVTAATSAVVNANYNTTAQAAFAVHPAPVPTFVDDFNSGTLNKANWIVSNYTAGNYGGAGSDVTFTSSNIDMSQGMLRMELNQPTASISTGAEIQSKLTFGYGTYITVMRMASTSATANGAGGTVSGSDSSIFSYINNSESEIDTEFCANTPGLINYTNWDTLAKNQWTRTEHRQSSRRVSHLQDGVGTGADSVVHRQRPFGNTHFKCALHTSLHHVQLLGHEPHKLGRSGYAGRRALLLREERELYPCILSRLPKFQG